MNILSAVARLARLPYAVSRNIRVMYLLRNWREAIAAQRVRSSRMRLELRNGVVLDGPAMLDLLFLFHEIWVSRVYTPHGYEIRQNDIVIDVGANIGTFALYAATQASGVTVHAYEPFPGNVAWIRANIMASRLSNIQIHEQAVAGAAGTRQLYINDVNWIVHTLVQNESCDHPLSVPCTSLEAILAENAIQECHLLKLDCEGSEYEILGECDPAVLSRIRRIVGEYHEGAGILQTGRNLCRLLESRGFRVDVFHPFVTGGGIFAATRQ